MYDFYMENSLKNKIYQMFILGMGGENLYDNANLVHALEQNLGGVIFFTQNIKTSEQFKELIKNIKTESNSIPFLSIDQEGGRVERTENIFGGKKYLSAKFAAQNGEDFLKEQTTQIARELKDFGINLNFAPCLDVNTNSNNPIISERAFSDNVDEVIKFGKIVVNAYLENGIVPCTKHFPGHGDASVDSHLALPEIDLTLEEMEKNHIKPFKEVPSPMIMVAHLHCHAFDKEPIPSSISKNVIGYLREKLNYNGLIISDDMVMGGILNQNNTLNTCAQAIKAGINILLYRNTYDETIQIIEDLAKLAQEDKDLLKNINLSFEKITAFKSAFLR